MLPESALSLARLVAFLVKHVYVYTSVQTRHRHTRLLRGLCTYASTLLDSMVVSQVAIHQSGRFRLWGAFFYAKRSDPKKETE